MTYVAVTRERDYNFCSVAEDYPGMPMDVATRNDDKPRALAASRLSRRSALVRGTAAILTAGWGLQPGTLLAQPNTGGVQYVVFEGPINDTNTSRLMSIIS